MTEPDAVARADSIVHAVGDADMSERERIWRACKVCGLDPATDVTVVADGDADGVDALERSGYRLVATAEHLERNETLAELAELASTALRERYGFSAEDVAALSDAEQCRAFAELADREGLPPDADAVDGAVDGGAEP